MRVVVIGLALLLAACGGSTVTPSAPSGTSSNPSGALFHNTLTTDTSFSFIESLWSERSGVSNRASVDDFVSSESGAVRTIAWQGVRTTARRPSGFYLSFFSDNGSGFPLLEVYVATFTMAEVNERLVATHACENSPQQQCSAYDYSVTLPAPFSIVAGTRYWLLIQAESPQFMESNWSWRRGLNDNGRSIPGGFANTIQLWDAAFALGR